MESIQDSRIQQIKTIEDMFTILREKGRSLKEFKKGHTIHVWNKMEKGYSYELQENPGENFDSEFKPYADPGEILALGAFGGKYLNDCLLEFPSEWFWKAGLLGKLSPGEQKTELNYFEIDSRLPLGEWKRKGWVPGSKAMSGVKGILADKKMNPDIRGWFQWYCRYYMGRRIPTIDQIQIARWKAFRRHGGAIKKNCRSGDMTCRPRQRQALLQWAYNPFI